MTGLPILIATLMFMSPALFGKARSGKAAPAVAANSNTKPEVSMVRPAVKSRGVSETYRTEKHGLVGFGFGSPGTGMLMPGAEFYVFLGPRFQLGLNYFKSQQDLTGQTNSSLDASTASVVFVDDVLMKGEAANINLRFFMGNSFFASLGFGQHTYDIGFGIKPNPSTTLVSSDDFFDSSLKVKKIVSSFSIGNQWLFDGGFSLTGEWIGMSTPIASSYEMENNYGGFVAQSAATSVLDDQIESLGKKLSASSQALFMLSLGLAI